jgi:hypothetical protein
MRKTFLAIGGGLLAVSAAYAAHFLANDFGGLPEPAGWAILLGSFAIVGAALRRRKFSPTRSA